MTVQISTMLSYNVKINALTVSSPVDFTGLVIFIKIVGIAGLRVPDDGARIGWDGLRQRQCAFNHKETSEMIWPIILASFKAMRKLPKREQLLLHLQWIVERDTNTMGQKETKWAWIVKQENRSVLDLAPIHLRWYSLICYIILIVAVRPQSKPMLPAFHPPPSSGDFSGPWKSLQHLPHSQPMSEPKSINLPLLHTSNHVIHWLF